MDRSGYQALRRRYQPTTIKLAIIAESPPSSGKYFYDPTGSTGEPLFTALMQQLRFEPRNGKARNKKKGLAEFQRRGWILIDATYQPVNDLTESSRNKIIDRDYPRLRSDLESLITDRSTPIILVKANVYRLLKRKLMNDRFNVINHCIVVYFPANGHQKQFHRQFGAVMRSEKRRTA
jgi:hypothetical protein